MRTYSAREWAERLTMRVSPADIERLGRTMLVTIDRVSSSRWEAAVGRAAALGGDVRPEKTDSPLFTSVDALEWVGPTEGFAECVAELGDGRLLQRARSVLDQAARTSKPGSKRV